MRRYIGKRALSGLLMVIISVMINFTLIRLAPGDPIKIMAGTDNPNPDMIAALTEKYGLNKSIPEQFVIFVGGIFKGDLGYSYLSDEPVITMIAQKIVPTLLLSLSALAISVTIGTFLGIQAARRHNSRFDRILSGISYVFDSTPSFWLGMMLILLFASKLEWFPTSGMNNLRAGYTGFRHIVDVMYHLFLPVTTLVLIQIPYYFRISRSSVLQVMSEDFITTFKATGMNNKKIFNKYVFKNAILPTITVVGMNIAFLLSGAVLLETVFAWPGMGRLLMGSIGKRDYPVLQGIYFVLSLSVAAMMILVDIVYGIVDPRIKHD